MKKLRISMGIVLAALMLLAPTAALASRPVECPEHRIWVEVDPETVAPGDTFTVRLMQYSPAGTAAAEVGEFKFDHTLVEILEVTMGAGYRSGMMAKPPGDPIGEANADGSLNAFGCFFIPPGKCEAGEQEFLVITMKAEEGITGTHTVPLMLPDAY